MNRQFLEHSLESWKKMLENSRQLIRMYNTMLRKVKATGDIWRIEHYTKWRENEYKNRAMAQRYVRYYERELEKCRG